MASLFVGGDPSVGVCAAAGGILTGLVVCVGIDLYRWRSALDSLLARAKGGPGVNAEDEEEQQQKELELSQLFTIRNRRYRIPPSFISRHPGGVTAIELGRGRDCTALFEAYHSLAPVGKMDRVLQQFELREGTALAFEACCGDPDYSDEWAWGKNATPFFDAMRRRVRDHFLALEGEGGPYSSTPYLSAHKAPFHKWAWLLFFCLLTAACLRGFFAGHLPSMLLLPVCYWLGPSTMMHDGGHFSLSRSPWVNRAAALLGGAHMSPSTWAQQHTIGHHVHTNVEGRDPDLYHFTFLTRLGLLGFRTSPSSRWEPSHAFWRLGLLTRVCLATAGPSFLWDALSHAVAHGRFLGLVAGPPAQAWTSPRLAVHLLGRLLVAAVAFAQPLFRGVSQAAAAVHAHSLQHRQQQQLLQQQDPHQHHQQQQQQQHSQQLLLQSHDRDHLVLLIAMHHVMRGVLFAIAPFAIHGVIFYAFSQVSHVQEDCFEPREGCRDDRDDAADDLAADASTEKKPQKTTTVTTTMTPTVTTTTRTRKAKREGPPLLQKGKKMEWAVHQVLTTLDWDTGSLPWLYLSNGLNHQTLHHLFPQVDWAHHRALAPILETTCREFGVPYRRQPSFWAALRSHYGHLANVNGDWEEVCSGAAEKAKATGTTRTAKEDRRAAEARASEAPDDTDDDDHDDARGTEGWGGGTLQARVRRAQGAALAKDGTRSLALGGLALLGQLDYFHYEPNNLSNSSGFLFSGPPQQPPQPPQQPARQQTRRAGNRTFQGLWRFVAVSLSLRFREASPFAAHMSPAPPSPLLRLRAPVVRRSIAYSSSSSSRSSSSSSSDGSPSPVAELNLLYDSKCAVCQWEVDHLTANGAVEQGMTFTDIESPDYDPDATANGGVSYEAGMRSISAVRPADGAVLTGPEAFRAAYALAAGRSTSSSSAALSSSSSSSSSSKTTTTVGEEAGKRGESWLGRFWGLTAEQPLLSLLVDIGYGAFAAARTVVTRGGRTVGTLVAERELDQEFGVLAGGGLGREANNAEAKDGAVEDEDAVEVALARRVLEYACRSDRRRRPGATRVMAALQVLQRRRPCAPPSAAATATAAAAAAVLSPSSLFSGTWELVFTSSLAAVPVISGYMPNKELLVWDLKARTLDLEVFTLPLLPPIKIRGEDLSYTEADATLTYSASKDKPPSTWEVFHADGDIIAAVSSATGTNIIRRVREAARDGS